MSRRIDTFGIGAVSNARQAEGLNMPSQRRQLETNTQTTCGLSLAYIALHRYHVDCAMPTPIAR